MWYFSVAYPGILFGGGFQQIQFEDRDLGVVGPSQDIPEAAVISHKKFHFI